MASDDEVGNDIVCVHRFALPCPRLGVEAANTLDGSIQLLLVELQHIHDAVIVVVDKKVETAINHQRCPMGDIILPLGAVQLNGKTLLQIAGSDAGRV